MDIEKKIEATAAPEVISRKRQQVLGQAVLVSIAIQGGIEYPSHDPQACYDYVLEALPEDYQMQLTEELTAMYPEDMYQPAQLFRFILQSGVMSSSHEQNQQTQPWAELANADDKRLLQLTEAGNAAMMDIYRNIRSGDGGAQYVLDQVIQRTAPADC